MPGSDLTQFPNVFANGPGNIPDADLMMADLQHLRTYLNTAGNRKLDRLESGNSGDLIICNASGVPTYVSNAGAQLGLNDGNTVRRGKSIIPTEESRTNTAYGLMSTADQVQDIVVPAGATVRLEYAALWKESVIGAARAAIFIDSNQLKVRSQDFAAPVTQAAGRSSGGADEYSALQSFPLGLFAVRQQGVAATSDVTTGQALGLAGTITPTGGPTNFVTHEVNGVIVALNQAYNQTGNSGAGDNVLSANDYGGECRIRNLAADTYTFSVQFKASSGSVTVKERELKVVVESF